MMTSQFSLWTWTHTARRVTCVQFLFVAIAIASVAACSDQRTPAGDASGEATNADPTSESADTGSVDMSSTGDALPKHGGNDGRSADQAVDQRGAGGSAAATGTRTNAIDAAIAEVFVMEGEAKFREALVATRELRSKPRLTVVQRRQLDELQQRLIAARSEAARLRVSIDVLVKNEDADAVDIAEIQLMRSGPAGRLLLRQVVVDAPSASSFKAAELLVQMSDESAAAAILTRLRREQDVNTQRKFAELLLELAPKLDVTLLADMADFAKRDGRLHAAQLENIRLTRLQGTIQVGEADALLNRLSIVNEASSSNIESGAATATHTDGMTNQDAQWQEAANAARDAADVLIDIHLRVAKRDDAAFNAMFTTPDAIETLRQYAAAASEATDPRIREWAAQAMVMLKPIDAAALRVGLVAWYTFDQIEDAVVTDQSGGSHDATLMNTSADTAIVPGRIGQAISFRGGDDHIDTPVDDVLGKLHHESYSMACWFNPGDLPRGRQPDMVSALVVKDGEGWNIGMKLNRQGRVQGAHILADNSTIGAVSSTMCKPGQWRHAAWVVDRGAGEVRIYIDGKLEGVNTFEPGAEASVVQDENPIRIGLARPNAREWASRYRGVIDEVRLYNRAITGEDVLALFLEAL